MNIIYLSKKVTDEELKSMFYKVYDVDRSQNIIMSYDYNFADLFDENHKLILDEDFFDTSHIIEKIEINPDYPTLLTIYPRGELNNDEVYTDTIIAQRIAKELNCECLISGEDQDPYDYKQVMPTGEVRRVCIDFTVKNLDETFVISNYRFHNEVDVRRAGKYAQNLPGRFNLGDKVRVINPEDPEEEFGCILYKDVGIDGSLIYFVGKDYSAGGEYLEEHEIEPL